MTKIVPMPDLRREQSIGSARRALDAFKRNLPAVDEWNQNLKLTMETGVKLKKVMQKRALRRARCKCPSPDCAGIIHGELRGPKDHLHFRCDGSCNMMMME